VIIYHVITTFLFFQEEPSTMASKVATKLGIKRTRKVTSIGHSPFTRFNSKNDKRNKKPYRGQG
jgi:hypothetical protein